MEGSSPQASSQSGSAADPGLLGSIADLRALAADASLEEAASFLRCCIECLREQLCCGSAASSDTHARSVAIVIRGDAPGASGSGASVAGPWLIKYWDSRNGDEGALFGEAARSGCESLKDFRDLDVLVFNFRVGSIDTCPGVLLLWSMKAGLQKWKLLAFEWRHTANRHISRPPATSVQVILDLAAGRTKQRFDEWCGVTGLCNHDLAHVLKQKEVNIAQAVWPRFAKFSRATVPHIMLSLMVQAPPLAEFLSRPLLGGESDMMELAWLIGAQRGSAAAAFAEFCRAMELDVVEVHPRILQYDRSYTGNRRDACESAFCSALFDVQTVYAACWFVAAALTEGLAGQEVPEAACDVSAAHPPGDRLGIRFFAATLKWRSIAGSDAADLSSCADGMDSCSISPQSTATFHLPHEPPESRPQLEPWPPRFSGTPLVLPAKTEIEGVLPGLLYAQIDAGLVSALRGPIAAVPPGYSEKRLWERVLAAERLEESGSATLYSSTMSLICLLVWKLLGLVLRISVLGLLAATLCLSRERLSQLAGLDLVLGLRLGLPRLQQLLLLSVAGLVALAQSYSTKVLLVPLMMPLASHLALIFPGVNASGYVGSIIPTGWNIPIGWNSSALAAAAVELPCHSICCSFLAVFAIFAGRHMSFRYVGRILHIYVTTIFCIGIYWSCKRLAAVLRLREQQATELLYDRADRLVAPVLSSRFAALGGLFVKLGQWLSSVTYGVPLAWQKHMKRLQDSAARDTEAHVRALLQAEFGRPIEQLFQEFTMEPLASASIAQVHAAVMHSGQKVAVKIQHEGIDELMRSDLVVLKRILGFCCWLGGPTWEANRRLMDSWMNEMLSELDFCQEVANLSQVRKGLAAAGLDVIVPSELEGATLSASMFGSRLSKSYGDVHASKLGFGVYTLESLISSHYSRSGLPVAGDWRDELGDRAASATDFEKLLRVVGTRSLDRGPNILHINVYKVDAQPFDCGIPPLHLLDTCLVHPAALAHHGRISLDMAATVDISGQTRTRLGVRQLPAFAARTLLPLSNASGSSSQGPAAQWLSGCGCWKAQASGRRMGVAARDRAAAKTDNLERPGLEGLPSLPPTCPRDGPLETVAAIALVSLMLFSVMLAGLVVKDAEAAVVQLLPASVPRLLREVPGTWQIFSAWVFSLTSFGVAISKPHLIEAWSRDEGILRASYGPLPHQQLMLFGGGPGAVTSEPRPLVVFVHGGSWSHSRFWMYKLLGRRLESAGFAVAVVGYGQYPRSNIPDMVADLSLALSWLGAQSSALGISGGRPVLLGHSSGGHLCALAALLGKEGHSLAGVATMGSPMDIADHYDWEKQRGVEDMSALFPAFGGELGFAPLSPTQILLQKQRPSSALQLRTESTPSGLNAPSRCAFFVGHGLADWTVPPTSAERFAAAAQLGGAEVELHLWPGLGHFDVLAELMGLGRGSSEAQAAAQEVQDFLSRCLVSEIPSDADAKNL
ncbi:unnamed protein product [Polarella glacialis]|uniref:ABC1 atypical kinase-like domain-containing protein n=1 Tax=Polarella glacialis TaxID=89957 RepID=A0A813HAR9_POLGL|nr:unnamed protein product [Polarella glacialis]